MKRGEVAKWWIDEEYPSSGGLRVEDGERTAGAQHRPTHEPANCLRIPHVRGPMPICNAPSMPLSLGGTLFRFPQDPSHKGVADEKEGVDG